MFGGPSGTRTRFFSVTGRNVNPSTNGPKFRRPTDLLSTGATGKQGISVEGCYFQTLQEPSF